MIFFTADTHFRHANCIRFCNRPFSSAEEMDETMIANWNRVVTTGDTVYHLGDFSFCDPSLYLKRLNGSIKLVPGNHDKKQRFNNAVEMLPALCEIKIDEQLIVLCHYAMRVWNKAHYGSFSLHGHSHGNLPDIPTSRSIDVGVDCHNFTPISFEQVKEIMSKKTFVPIDHHRGQK